MPASHHAAPRRPSPPATHSSRSSLIFLIYSPPPPNRRGTRPMQLPGLAWQQGVGVRQPGIVELGHDDTSYKVVSFPWQMGDPCVEEVTNETRDTSQEAKGVAF